MPATCPVRPRPPAPRRPAARRRGFTVLEVAMSAFVLAFGIVSSITTLQYGLRQVDLARSTTLAGQIVQSEIELLRLQNWAQIVALQTAQASPTTPTTIDTAASITSGSSTPLDATLTTIANRFACTRLIEDISGKADMKRVTLNATWTGVDGRPHQLSFQLRYARNGLSDYFYVAH